MFEEKMEILRGIVKAGYPCPEEKMIQLAKDFTLEELKAWRINFIRNQAER